MIENLTQQYSFGDEWLKRTNTGFLSRSVRLGSPIIKQMFKRNYLKASRDIFFLSVFAQYLVKDQNQVRKIQEIVRRSADKANKALETRIAQLEAVVADAGVDSSLSFTQILEADTPLTSPVSKSVLSLFVEGDRLHGLAQACWIDGAITDEEKQNIEDELKKTIRSFISTVRGMMGTTFSAMQKQKQQGNLTPEAVTELEEASSHVESSNDEDAGEVDKEALAEAASVFAPAAANAAQHAEVATA